MESFEPDYWIYVSELSVEACMDRILSEPHQYAVRNMPLIPSSPRYECIKLNECNLLIIFKGGRRTVYRLSCSQEEGYTKILLTFRDEILGMAIPMVSVPELDWFMRDKAKAHRIGGILGVPSYPETREQDFIDVVPEVLDV